ncbi:ThiF family adenylyltransferase [Belliella aquatica]|uniref:Molybdenum cofactor biosynthesis protein MoeB n=1 Tax=Belliella aquatica TaxID=1323734 RepID=A0ABQ1MDI2_9BACT|nr:ThiF family adenylyltransferase [Belliella aquatica]MCH7405522.1 ThiF family adenylyltransferase [Belliella aquatica]GGC35631.1 molybdenum cofactor biosynthesis protein MoeB [Belliella aquatica]
MDRFDRHYNLKGFGKAGQEKLQNAKVLVVGAGGLGCPILLYLAAVGVGKIGIVDGDSVSESNLSRQVLFGQHDLGKNKAKVAGKILNEKYANLEVEVIPEFLRTDNIIGYLQDYDLVIDGSDNFPTRYLVNDACVVLNKPLVFGALYQNEGQVAVFNAKGSKSINYRDIYPNPPSAGEVPNCNEIGILGVFPGIIGCTMAAEAIKLISGFGEILDGKMHFYNFLNHSDYKIELTKNQQSYQNRPKSIEDLQSMDYQDFCGLSADISWEEVRTLMHDFPDAFLVDVRGKDEEPQLEGLAFQQIETDQIDASLDKIAQHDTILLFCQTGIRSAKAARKLQEKFPDKYIRSIKGGITSFK